MNTIIKQQLAKGYEIFPQVFERCSKISYTYEMWQEEGYRELEQGEKLLIDIFFS